MSSFNAILSHVTAMPPPLEEDDIPEFETGRHFYMLASDEQPINYSKKGKLTREEPAVTFTKILAMAEEKIGNTLFMAVERPAPAMEEPGVAPSLPWNQWKKWTITEFLNDSKLAAKAFIELGLEQFGCISIFGFNAPEWFISAVAAVFAGGKFGGIYLTDTAETVQYKIHHSGSCIAVVDGENEYNLVMSKINETPDLTTIVTWGMQSSLRGVARNDGSNVQVKTFHEILRMGGEEGSDVLLTRRMEAQRPGHAFSLIYTSGTTGQPKAVMISHDNGTGAYLTLAEMFAECNSGPGGGRIISYLPLSHVAGCGLDLLLPLQVGARRGLPCCTYFARPYDLKALTLVNRINFVEPTFFFAVPRVFEKMMARMKGVAATITGVKKSIATWAKGVGAQKTQNFLHGGNRTTPFGHSLADKLILSKARAALGLGKCGCFVTGAAPISIDTLQYFGALGIEILNVYGMSEVAGLATMSFPGRNVFGCIGERGFGMDVRCFRTDASGNKVEAKRCAPGAIPKEEEQGEICFRGRLVMMGYMANPKLGPAHMKEIEKKNEETIDAQGWLHSGDKGCMDTNGFFRITGRYKELIIGAGGENIAPVPVEECLKAHCPALANVMMIGDNRPYNVMLVTLVAQGATGEFPGGDDLDGLALEVSPSVTKVSQAMNDPVWRKYIQTGLDATNNTPSVCQSNAWKVQKFAILPRDFSIETGELTSTLKLKRSVAVETWCETIDALYKES